MGGEFFPRIIQALEPADPLPKQLIIIYSNQANLQYAQTTANQLSNQLNLEYQLVSGLTPNQLTLSDDYLNLVFITDPNLITAEMLKALNQPHTLSFAPFIGSVARGVDVGLVVKAGIRPQLNTAKIAKRHWAFRPFFNSIASHYPTQEAP
ncbi:hypothetical protein [Thiomicrospira sp. ALE5]|uniref:hypothetical protein n=1 Tax=Thiomicrospira sp. ALE5 TaxID=748650 RepID=UPI001F15D6BF|nr:hypothetical protein [Thiomicrospira sp. ALE5]